MNTTNYRLDSMSVVGLTSAEIEKYWSDGFLKVPAHVLFDVRKIAEIVLEVSRIQALPECAGKYMVYLDDLEGDQRRLNRIENFLPYSSILWDTFIDSQLQHLVANLMGDEVVLFKDKINFKQAGGEGFLPHQDAQAEWDRYGHTRHITVAAAVDRCTLQNGCLEFVKGKHLDGLLGPVGKEIPNEVVSNLEWIPITAESGDLIFFDSYTPHRSSSNNTDSQRRLLYMTYNLKSEGDTRLKYFQEKRTSYPPNFERIKGLEYKYKI